MPRQNRKQAYEDAKKQADAAGLCVADVVKVLAFDEAALTVDVQPITRYPDEDTFQTKPPVLAVPVATIYGGGFVIRPVYKAGDIGVVVYLDRDSDAVIAGGAEADPNTERLHSGDDAVFVGGIRTGGFDPETLESWFMPGLFVCGELLDIDGDCGGYNLQWAWASGRLAGRLGL